MKVLCCDDNPMHLSMIQSVLKTNGTKNGPVEIWKTATDGRQAVLAFQEALKNKVQLDLVTLDIRMPNMDGLSALVKIRQLSPSQKIVMASSEDEQTMKRFTSGKIGQMPLSDKIVLLEKVKTRIISGVIEAGKINSILEACEELLFDPIDAAKHFKANGYLHKPYKVEHVRAVLENVAKNGSFLAKVG